MRNEESLIQQQSVKWFALQHPKLWEQKKLHAVPNGGKRGKITAGIMKAEGARAGVWDLHLTVPRGKYAGLWIEVKTAKGTLTDEQKAFRASHEQDYAFAVCRSVEQFLEAINNYLNS